MWPIWPSTTPHFIRGLNLVIHLLVDRFFDGKDFGCKTIQSTPSTLWIKVIELGSVLSISKFSNGVSIIWSLNELHPPTQPKSIFPLTRECALTSGSKHVKVGQKNDLPKILFKNNDNFLQKHKKIYWKIFYLSFLKHLCLHWVYGNLNIKFEKL